LAYVSGGENSIYVYKFTAPVYDDLKWYNVNVEQSEVKRAF